MKDIKIIFFDIDGTLIAMDQDTISEKTLEALKRLQEKGVKLCLATGRGPMLVPHFEGVEFDAFLTYNGSYCYDHSGTLYSNCIPLKDIERIIKNADKMGKPVALATKDRMAANGKDQDLIDYYIPKAIVTITVVDVSGSPIQDATVTVGGVQYKTLSDGTVKVRGMANGTMSLSVKKDGYMPFSDNSWKLADSRITLEVLRNTVITENGYSILLENDGLILTE